MQCTLRLAIKQNQHSLLIGLLGIKLINSQLQGKQMELEIPKSGQKCVQTAETWEIFCPNILLSHLFELHLLSNKLTTICSFKDECSLIG